MPAPRFHYLLYKPLLRKIPLFSQNLHCFPSIQQLILSIVMHHNLNGAIFVKGLRFWRRKGDLKYHFVGQGCEIANVFYDTFS